MTGWFGFGGGSSSTAQKNPGVRPEGDATRREGNVTQDAGRTENKMHGEESPALKSGKEYERKSAEGERQETGWERGANTRPEGNQVHGETNNDEKMRRELGRAKREAKKKADELEDMKEKTAAAKKSKDQQIADLEERIRAQDRKIRDQTDEIHARKELADREGRERAWFQAANSEMAATAQQTKQQIGDMQKQLANAEQENRNLNHHVQEQNRTITTLKNEANTAETKRVQNLRLLEIRTTELKGAQAYLTKADMISGVDVISMVESLNSEILQASAYAADKFNCAQTTIAIGEWEQMAAHASNVLGINVVRILWPRQPDGDSMRVQITLQACMIKLCKDAISAWIPYNPQHNDMLVALYAGIQEAEDQVVSRRWRALTRAQGRRLAGGDPYKHWMSCVIGCLVDLLTLAGCTTPNLGDAVTEALGNRLSIMGKLVAQLNKAVGEDVTSGDLEAVSVPPNAIFDPETMDDAYADSRLRKGNTSPEERVVSTSDMGLCQITRKYRDGSREHERVVLLKPKVVLYSALELRSE